MIEINSDKIDKQKLQIHLEHIIKSSKKQTDKSFLPPPTMTNKTVYNSFHQTTAFKLLKKAEKIFYMLGLSGFVNYIKPKLKLLLNKPRQLYTVDDFLHYYDKEFVEYVYKVVLKRKPEKEALQHYLSYLRSGKYSRTQILSLIRYSKEGRLQGVKILGLKKRYILTLLTSIPYLGYFVKIFIFIATIPRYQSYQNAKENLIYLKEQELYQLINKKADKNQLQTELKLLQSEIDKKVNLEDFYKDISSLQAVTKELETSIKKEISHLEKNISLARSSIRETYSNIKGLIEQAKQHISEKDSNFLQDIIKEEKYLLDDIYVAFENAFRGDKKDIKKRLEYYLPFVKKVVTDDKPVIDVGCGRGEWLELLKENDIKSIGIDLNKLMIKEAQKGGLEAYHADAIRYLKSLEPQSVSVVSGFHIVEHLPFEILIELFDQAYRVLKKGGMIIFETPNPENLLVGTFSFYTDPTHKNPIPPHTLEFLAKERGFTDVKVHKLHPLKSPVFVDTQNSDDINFLIARLATEQDYAVVGYKDE